MDDRVVITGLGTINALGHNINETWTNIQSGVSGAGPLTLFDASEMGIWIACEVKHFDPADHLPVKEVRRRDRYQHFAVVAAREALLHAGLAIDEHNAARVGVVVSSAGGGLSSFQETALTIKERGARWVSPFSSAMYMSNGGAGMTSIDVGARGPSFSVASACASGADGIGIAWQLIKAGVIDAALAGASDAAIAGVSVGSLARSGAMSTSNGDSLAAPRPFDLHRDGFVMGEGAAVMVLESERHARERGAEILAEVAGYAATSDAYHITAPLEDGSGAAMAMQNALNAAGVVPREIDYINAHGTGTVLNDASETKAIKDVFGEAAYDIPVSSTKSMTGHMMGSTAALEVAFCVLAIKDGLIPPTINYETPDPVCDLDYVPNEAREARVNLAMTNAFGFGGHNAVLVLRRYG